MLFLFSKWRSRNPQKHLFVHLFLEVLTFGSRRYLTFLRSLEHLARIHSRRLNLVLLRHRRDISSRFRAHFLRFLSVLISQGLLEFSFFIVKSRLQGLLSPALSSWLALNFWFTPASLIGLAFASLLWRYFLWRWFLRRWWPSDGSRWF
jgi:hypothetical protein